MCVNKIVYRSMGEHTSRRDVLRLPNEEGPADDDDEHPYFIVVLLSKLKRTSDFHEYWITECVVDTGEQEPQDVNVLRVW